MLEVICQLILTVCFPLTISYGSVISGELNDEKNNSPVRIVEIFDVSILDVPCWQLGGTAGGKLNVTVFSGVEERRVTSMPQINPDSVIV